MGRKTRLKFNDFILDYIDITNSIGQGDPLSMLLYVLYNADLLEALQQLDEDAIGYVDDALVIVTAKTLKESTWALKNYMEQREGASIGLKTTIQTLRSARSQLCIAS